MARIPGVGVRGSAGLRFPGLWLLLGPCEGQSLFRPLLAITILGHKLWAGCLGAKRSPAGPGLLQLLTPQPCFSGPCQRPEVRGQERHLLEGDPERALQLRFRWQSHEGLGCGEWKGFGVGRRIPGQPLPWPRPPSSQCHPVAVGFRGSSRRLIPQLLESPICFPLSALSQQVFPEPGQRLPGTSPFVSGLLRSMVKLHLPPRAPWAAGPSRLLALTQLTPATSSPPVLTLDPAPSISAASSPTPLASACSLVHCSGCQALPRERRHWGVRSLQFEDSEPGGAETGREVSAQGEKMRNVLGSHRSREREDRDADALSCCIREGFPRARILSWAFGWSLRAHQGLFQKSAERRAMHWTRSGGDKEQG